jgi:hypothetical protein
MNSMRAGGYAKAIKSRDPLVCFLYLLGRDQLTLGELEALVMKAEANSDASFSNDFPGRLCRRDSRSASWRYARRCPRLGPRYYPEGAGSMICETCRHSGRPGYVCRPGAISSTYGEPGWVPCPDCGGSTIAHCCDGLTACNDPILVVPPSLTEAARSTFPSASIIEFDGRSVNPVSIRTCPRTKAACYDARCARDWCQREEHYP